MRYTQATIADIDDIFKLQQRYHVATINEEDKKDGFVTTLFTKEQLQALIEQENGISIAVDNDGKIVGYAMAGSWDYWSEWPLFQYMIEDLKNVTYDNEQMSIENSYQYGPICLAKEVRNQGIMEELFNYSLSTMADRYPYMITFVNTINPRSYEAHVRKAKMDVIKTFPFNNNKYWMLGIKTK
ncbi:hypothetical protein LJB88_01955 [Erysipelotrichaceae bacterium OttesenSCG-928-M19]|nr:hypothetical protein [Erysipelotrichaceae bacterium OttesenSCG-928-M19]